MSKPIPCILKGHMFVCRDGTVIASASTDGLCRLWDLRTAKLLRTLLLPDASRPFTCVQFSPNGRFLSAVDDAGGFNVWDWRNESGAVVRQFTGHSGCVEAQFLQDKHAVSFSKKGQFDIWNLESSKVSYLLLQCRPCRSQSPSTETISRALFVFVVPQLRV